MTTSPSFFSEIRRLGRAVGDDCKAIPPALAWTPGREGYLAWRAAWRAEMREIVAAIVAAKKDRRAAGDNRRWSAQMNRERLRCEAFAMLAVRAASKKKAGTERAARLAALAA